MWVCVCTTSSHGSVHHTLETATALFFAAFAEFVFQCKHDSRDHRGAPSGCFSFCVSWSSPRDPIHFGVLSSAGKQTGTYTQFDQALLYFCYSLSCEFRCMCVTRYAIYSAHLCLLQDSFHVHQSPVKIDLQIWSLFLSLPLSRTRSLWSCIEEGLEYHVTVRWPSSGPVWLLQLGARAPINGILPGIQRNTPTALMRPADWISHGFLDH